MSEDFVTAESELNELLETFLPDLMPDAQDEPITWRAEQLRTYIHQLQDSRPASCSPFLDAYLAGLREQGVEPKQPPLEPCPFCQESVALNLRADGPKVRYAVCQNCETTGPKFETFLEAALAWNAPANVEVLLRLTGGAASMTG